jgi:hypothetical protein
MESTMPAETFDLLFTYGLTALVATCSLVGVAALPWRSSDLRSSVDAWSLLSSLSGGFARSGWQVVRTTADRVLDLSVRRPTPAMTRTLS